MRSINHYKPSCRPKEAWERLVELVHPLCLLIMASSEEENSMASDCFRVYEWIKDVDMNTYILVLATPVLYYCYILVFHDSPGIQHRDYRLLEGMFGRMIVE